MGQYYSGYSKPAVSKINRKYGWRRGFHTLGDSFKIFKHGHATLPTSVDLRDKMPAIYCQGELGSCVSNAVAAAVQYDLMCGDVKLVQPATTAPATPATPATPSKDEAKKAPSAATAGVDTSMRSRLFIYYNARSYDGDVPMDNGTSIHSGVRAVVEAGACPESVWPYTPSAFATKPSAAAYKTATVTKADPLAVAWVARDLTQLQGALSEGFPVVCGIVVYQSFETAVNGNIPMPQATEGVLGGHAILLVGYDNAKNCFIFRNSWSELWGDKGYGYIPYQYICNLMMSDEFCIIKKLDLATLEAARAEAARAEAAKAEAAKTEVARAEAMKAEATLAVAKAEAALVTAKAEVAKLAMKTEGKK